MSEERVNVITVLNEKEFQFFRKENKIEASFIDSILHPSLVSVLKEYMIERFGEDIQPVLGLSCLDNQLVKLRDLNTELGMSIFDYLSVETGDILVELKTTIYNIVSIKISKIFEINRVIKKTKNCSPVMQEIFKNSLFMNSSVDGDIYSFLPNVTFATCEGCVKIEKSWEKSPILNFKDVDTSVNLLNIF